MLRNLLIVDDNPADVRYTNEMLDEAGIACERHVVSDGVEAIAYLRRRGEYADAPRPDLVFLDWYLPRKDGRKVLAELKGDERLSRIPVVVLTGTRLERDALQAESPQAEAYEVKPIDANEIRRLTERLVAPRQTA